MDNNMLYFILGLIFSIPIGLIINYIWARLTTPFSFGTSKDIDIRGLWHAKTKVRGEIVSEKLYIQRQFMGRVSGLLKTPDPDRVESVLEYNFQGYLINANTVRYWFWPRGKSFSDYGVGIFEIDRNHKQAHGIAVLYGIFSRKIITAPYDLERDR